MRILLLYFFLFTIGLSAQDREIDLIRFLEQANTTDRILELCVYQETIYFNPINQDRAGVDELFIELYRIAENDKEFRAYVDFYHRTKPMFFSDMYGAEAVHRRLELYREVLGHYLAVGDARFIGICYMQIAQDQYFLDSYDLSVENLLKANGFFMKAGYGNIPAMSKYLHEMALIFLFYRQYEKVAELMEASVQLPAIDRNRGIQRYNNLAIAYQNLNRLDEAEKAFRTALQKAERDANLIWIALISRNMSNISIEKGNLDEALRLCESTLPYLDKEREKEQHAKHLLKMAEIFLLMKKDIPYAFSLIDESEKLFFPTEKVFYYFGEKQQHEKFRQDRYTVKHRYFKNVGNYEMAYRYSDSLNALKRRQDSVYNGLQIHLAKQRLHIQKSLSEIETAKQEKEVLSVRAWAIGTGIAFLTVIFILLFYIGRTKRKKEKEEYLTKEQKMKKEEKRLNHELENLKIQMDHHLEKIKESNILIKQYKTETTEGDAKIDIENLKILTKEHWKDFIQDFKKVHKRFYTKITKTYPDLTPSELRLVLLLKLGINTKDLPGVLGTSDVNIRVTMHRLRQKIGQTGTGIKDREINAIVGLL